MLLKLFLFLYCIVFWGFYSRITQRVGIKIRGQRNEKHDKVAAARLSRRTADQHAVLRHLGGATSSSSRSPLPPDPPTCTQRGISSQSTTGLPSKAAACPGSCVTDCVAPVQLDNSFNTLDPSVLHTLSESLAGLDWTGLALGV